MENLKKFTPKKLLKVAPLVGCKIIIVENAKGFAYSLLLFSDLVAKIEKSQNLFLQSFINLILILLETAYQFNRKRT